MISKIFITNTQCEEAYNILLERIKVAISLGLKPDIIAAPLFGGLWFGRKLAKDIGVKLETINISFKRNEFEKDTTRFSGKVVLFVDDIYDSGNTLEWFARNMDTASLHAYTLFSKNPDQDVVVYKKSQKLYYTFIYGVYVPEEMWAVFPWEPEYLEIYKRDTQMDLFKAHFVAFKKLVKNNSEISHKLLNYFGIS